MTWHSGVPTGQTLACCPNIGALLSRRMSHRSIRPLVAKDTVLVQDMVCAYEVHVVAFELAVPGGDLLPIGQGPGRQDTVSRRLTHRMVCESTAGLPGWADSLEAASPRNAAASEGVQQAVDARTTL